MEREERKSCRCDCKSVAFLHLTAAAPLPSPPPALPAPHGLNKYWLCHFSQKCVKPFACVWRTTTKADSVARAVEISNPLPPLQRMPFILWCLRNTLVKLHNKRARKLPKRKLQFMPKKHLERAWKRKNISLAQAAAAEVAATVAAAGASNTQRTTSSCWPTSRQSQLANAIVYTH